VNASEQLGELAKALAAAQGQMGNVVKDSANPFFKSKFLSLAGVWDGIRAPLSANGLCVIQSLRPADGGVGLTTRLVHQSGQWVESELFLPATKTDPQSFGSLISYARRYALMAIVGVAAADDDDAESAMGRNATQQNTGADNETIAKVRACKTIVELNTFAVSLKGQNPGPAVAKAIADRTRELRG
jgi:hypothetical protein